jgi:hypothetical protein
VARERDTLAGAHWAKEDVIRDKKRYHQEGSEAGRGGRMGNFDKDGNILLRTLGFRLAKTRELLSNELTGISSRPKSGWNLSTELLLFFNDMGQRNIICLEILPSREK